MKQPSESDPKSVDPEARPTIRRELNLVDVRWDETTWKDVIREVSELVDDQRGEVRRFQSHIVIATFHTLVAGGAFRAALTERYGDQVRVLHGDCTLIEGSFGGSGMLSVGFFTPGLSEALEVLAGLDYGSTARHDFPAWDNPSGAQSGKG